MHIKEALWPSFYTWENQGSEVKLHKVAELVFYSIRDCFERSGYFKKDRINSWMEEKKMEKEGNTKTKQKTGKNSSVQQEEID